MFPAHQKRLLALDGGGIMGIVTLAILKRIEDQLRPFSGRGTRFVLSDFFDYFGGTSTGAIIATGLAMGKSVDEMTDFYERCGPDMFVREALHRRLWQQYDERPLARKLQQVIGRDTVLEMQAKGTLKKLLLVVMRNAVTDSPWPISTNPAARYNDPAREDCNLRVPLWQLVRASTAAPVFFRPQIIRFGREARAFVDGGITPFNNPALLLFKKTVMPQYRLCWPHGEDKLMLVSVGTGFATGNQDLVALQRRTALGTAVGVPGELMRGIQQENDANCRILGRCVHGAMIDREIGALVPRQPLADDLGRAFLYARYDADLSPDALRASGLGDVDPGRLRMDNVAAIPDLKRVGGVAAEQVDMPRHFAPFMGWLAQAGGDGMLQP